MRDIVLELIQVFLGRTFPKWSSESNPDEPLYPLNSFGSEEKGHTPHFLQEGEEPSKSKHQASCDKVFWVEVSTCGPMT